MPIISGPVGHCGIPLFIAVPVTAAFPVSTVVMATIVPVAAAMMMVVASPVGLTIGGWGAGAGATARAAAAVVIVIPLQRKAARTWEEEAEYPVAMTGGAGESARVRAGRKKKKPRHSIISS